MLEPLHSVWSCSQLTAKSPDVRDFREHRRKTLSLQLPTQHTRTATADNGRQSTHLTDSQIADLVTWIDAGADWPAAKPIRAASAVNKGSLFTEREKSYWAFQPVHDPVPPAIKQTDWVQSDLDRFILAKLEAQGLRPSVPADKRTLLRRVTFDLTGLPPTPEAMAAFQADNSTGAFTQVVKRLLASRQYGERRGQRWLDCCTLR